MMFFKKKRSLKIILAYIGRKEHQPEKAIKKFFKKTRCHENKAQPINYK